MTLSSLCSWVLSGIGTRRRYQPQPCLTPACATTSSAEAGIVSAAPPQRQPRAALAVRIIDLDGCVVVSVAGEASTDNLQSLELALARLLARRVPLAVLDCSELTLLSSLAMGLLVGFRRDLGRRQGSVTLACVQPQVEQSLRAARLTFLFDLHATVEQALATAASR
jgi:anti-anti-sigma factor